MTTNRDDSIAALAEVLTKEQLANIISRNYSDQALAVMAEFDRGYVERFADTQYETESMEKLIGAYCDKLIDWKDLLHIAEYSCYSFLSEEYFKATPHKDRLTPLHQICGLNEIQTA